MREASALASPGLRAVSRMPAPRPLPGARNSRWRPLAITSAMTPAPGAITPRPCAATALLRSGGVRVSRAGARPGSSARSTARSSTSWPDSTRCKAEPSGASSQPATVGPQVARALSRSAPACNCALRSRAASVCAWALAASSARCEALRSSSNSACTRAPSSRLAVAVARAAATSCNAACTRPRQSASGCGSSTVTAISRADAASDIVVVVGNCISTPACRCAVAFSRTSGNWPTSSSASSDGAGRSSSSRPTASWNSSRPR